MERYISIFLLLFITLKGIAQSANELLKKGEDKVKIEDYKGAIIDFTNVLKIDST